MIAMGRLAEPAEIAATISFLVSPEAGYLTGRTIPVDGGFF
ncbi:MAG TPA: SDR family oxidoreductase [Pseudonocardiaceae bacterium]|nr:SDR family oxidoreductase [Pseudonocardiaceae bacterium]